MIMLELFLKKDSYRFYEVFMNERWSPGVPKETLKSNAWRV